MKTLISGHRLSKLESYDIGWIQDAIKSVLTTGKQTGLISYGLSGMASGVDLWFCQSCVDLEIPYTACIPFIEQEYTMSQYERGVRGILLAQAATSLNIRNNVMVEKSDMGIVVWDGNKGGTHNVLQQLIENHKPLIWINPVSEVVWDLTDRRKSIKI